MSAFNEVIRNETSYSEGEHKEGFHVLPNENE